MTYKNTPRLDPDELAADALFFIARWKWLRPTELGRLMYPYDPFARKYAEKLVRKLMLLKMLIARPLPGHQAGTAYVLSARGAAQLNEWSRAGGYRSGKDWGTTKEGGWAPPDSWRHDLIAAGVLTFTAQREGFDALPEAILRGQVPDAEKHPDGIVIDRNKGNSYWVEVEFSRKSGRNIDHMVRAVVKAARGTPLVSYDCIQDTPVTHGLVAIPREARDERGYKLNHWFRIESAIRKKGLKAPVRIVVAWVTMTGVGVGSVDFEVKQLQPD